MTTPQDLFIKGVWTSGYAGELLSRNPANQEIVWKGSSASESDVSRAVLSAKEATHSWSELSLDQRIHFLEAYTEQLKLSKGMLIETISQETGKPRWDAENEYQALIGKTALSIQAYRERCAERRLTLPSGISFTRHHPYGVLAVLGPFNFPAHLPNGHIIPALLAGNTVVFKPSEMTPKVGFLLAKCWEKSNLPAGVFNLIQGGSQIGKFLSAHPNINGLLFTGSCMAGKALLTQFAHMPGKILALEMGGNNPLVISSASDIQAAAYAIIQSAFLTTGQRCTCARRLIVIKGSEQILEKTLDLTKKLRIGSYTDDPDPFMGPLINERASINLITAQAVMIAEGGKALMKATMHEPNTCFMTPGIIDVTEISNKRDEEIFGPLLQVICVNTLQEAINTANHTRYGLCAGIFTEDPKEWHEFKTQIRAGIVNWNTPLTGASSASPFGGIGDSGNLRPSAYYAADYCSYPVASIENKRIEIPLKPTPGVMIE